MTSTRISIRRWHRASLAGVLLLLMLVPALGRGDPARAVPRVDDLVVRPGSQARLYNLGARALYFGGTLWVIAGTLALVRTGLCIRLRERFRSSHLAPSVSAMLMWCAVVGWSMAWSIPLRLAGIVWERRFGLDHTGWDRLALDFLLDAGIYALFAPVVAMAWQLLQSRQWQWWLRMGLLMAPVTLVTVVVWPIVADPLYNRVSPLPPGGLATRLRELSTRAGVPDIQVLVSKQSSRTSRVNAYVTGIGPSHRMVLWDTALRELTEEEVVAVAAHELGHYVYRHVWWGWAIGAAGSFLLFWCVQVLYSRLSMRWGGRLGLAPTGDIAGLPLLVLSLRLVMFAQTPVEAAISRGMETSADRYGLVVSRAPLASATAFARLAATNMSDTDPPRWLVLWSYSHPPIRERVAMALEAARRASPRPGPLHR